MPFLTKMSRPLRAAASSFTRTSPAAGWGSGLSPKVRTSLPPCAVKKTAFIAASARLRLADGRVGHNARFRRSLAPGKERHEGLGNPSEKSAEAGSRARPQGEEQARQGDVDVPARRGRARGRALGRGVGHRE